MLPDYRHCRLNFVTSGPLPPFTDGLDAACSVTRPAIRASRSISEELGRCGDFATFHNLCSNARFDHEIDSHNYLYRYGFKSRSHVASVDDSHQ
jgi:hypothetical protein